MVAKFGLGRWGQGVVRIGLIRFPALRFHDLSKTAGSLGPLAIGGQTGADFHLTELAHC